MGGASSPVYDRCGRPRRLPGARQEPVLVPPSPSKEETG